MWAKRRLSGENPSGDVIRDTIGKALFKLRFPVMTVHEFANIVVPKEVLCESEELLCFRYISQDVKPKGTMPFPTKPCVDNSCEYIHLKNTNQDLSNSQDVSFPTLIVTNSNVRDLYIKGFVSYERIVWLAYQMSSEGRWIKIEFQTHSDGTCLHNIGKSCITFPVLTIPKGNAYTLQMKSASDRMRCTQINSVEFFTDPDRTRSVVVNGDISIIEMLIAR